MCTYSYYTYYTATMQAKQRIFKVLPAETVGQSEMNTKRECFPPGLHEIAHHRSTDEELFPWNARLLHPTGKTFLVARENLGI